MNGNVRDQKVRKKLRAGILGQGRRPPNHDQGSKHILRSSGFLCSMACAHDIHASLVGVSPCMFTSMGPAFSHELEILLEVTNTRLIGQELWQPIFQ